MKFAISFMFQNEADWLKLHLPVFLKSAAVDGIVAVDGGSSDGGGDYVRSLGGVVLERPWDWKPMDQENAVISLAEWSGYDAILLTAPDELWFPAAIDQMKALMDDAKTFALQFPTWNFVKDRRHYAPQSPFFPDFHERVWRLGQGIRQVGALDSTPSFSPQQATRCMDLPMFHYSHIKPREWYTLKGLNFHRVRDGLEPLDKLPDGFEIEPYPMHVAFPWPQPLEPDEIGERAPIETPEDESRRQIAEYFDQHPDMVRFSLGDEVLITSEALRRAVGFSKPNPGKTAEVGLSAFFYNPPKVYLTGKSSDWIIPFPVDMVSRMRKAFLDAEG